MPHPRSHPSRRQFLRGAGILLSLPFLESALPAAITRAASRIAAPAPRRFFAVCNNLGLLHEDFFPAAGSSNVDSPYLALLKSHAADFSVFGGLSHPGVDGGHAADICFLTGAPHPGSGGFKNSISLDQAIAEQIGTQTRFSSLTLGVNIQQGQRSLSYSGTGVMVPCDERPSEVFRRLFVQGTEDEIRQQEKQLAIGGSILDAVARQAHDLQRRINGRDRDRLDQYFSSVRDLERRMESSKAWVRRPKPRLNQPVPVDPASPREYMEKVRLMYDLARLAFETDSTRSVSLMLDSANSPALDLPDLRISDGYHNLSHHGHSEAKLTQLKAIDHHHMNLLNGLLTDLKAVREEGETLLDRTTVLYGSNLGNANTHVNTNLPILMAGGGFRHGRSFNFDQNKNAPLPNLFVSILQRMNIETDTFSSATGTLAGLEQKA